MNDSREFHGVESNYSGKLSYVPSQPTVIPSPRSKLSCDERLPLDTWNTSGLQENVFGNQFSTFDSPRDHHQGIHSCASQRERGSVQQARRSGTPFTRDDKQSKNQIPMSTFASSPSTVSSLISVEFPQNSWLDRKDSKYRNRNSTNFLLHNHTWCGNTIQKSSDYLF